MKWPEKWCGGLLLAVLLIAPSHAQFEDSVKVVPKAVPKAEKPARQAEVDREIAQAAERVRRFRDCGGCPELVEIPGGRFRMGSSQKNDEKPAHTVEVSRFALGRYEVTFAEYDQCVSEGGCGHRPNDGGWGRGNRPVVNMSWADAQAYVKWLSSKTGKGYRLPSEAEWEYAARAGSTADYPWGNAIGRNRANCNGCGSAWDNKQTAPAGSFAANRYGLHDTVGNVWEWVEDCWNESYGGAPADGSAWRTGARGGRASVGGAWRAVARGSTSRRARAPPAAMGSAPVSGTTSWVFGWRGRFFKS